MAINLPILTKFDSSGIKAADSSLKKFGKVAAGIATAATAAVAGIATVSIKEFAKFDAALTKSTAIMGDVSDALRTDMADAAREVAKTTTFSAEQAAESYYFLASAGLDAAASIEAMPAVAQFAQAGMFDMALATDLLTDAQSALGLSIKDDAVANMENMVRVSDTLARASQLANATIEQFSTSLTTKAGTALKSVGKDVEEGAAALAVFADQGVKGELAGTQLTNTIFGLSDRAKAVPGQFEALGISVFDAAGNMNNFADIADDFTGAMADMSTEQKLATLSNLGFTKQARAGLLLLMENGGALRDYESALRDAGGTAEEVAGKQLQTFSAQLELMKSRVGDIGLTIGQAFMPALMSVTQALGPVIDTIGDDLAQAFQALVPIVTAVIGLLPSLVPIITKLLEIFTRIVEPIFEIAVTLFPLLEAVMASLIEPLAELAVYLFELLSQLLIPLIPVIIELVNAFGPLIEQIIPVLTELLDTLLPLMTILLQELIIPLIPVIMELIQAFMPLLTDVLPVLIDILQEFLIPVLQVVASILEFLLVNAIGIFTTAISNFSSFMSTFADDFKNIWDGIYGFVKGVINGIIGFVQGMVNAVITGVNSVIRALNTIKVSIPSWVPGLGGLSFGINLPTLSKMTIPRLADGGIVMPQPGGVLANLAEAGKPEAVIPLDRMGSMGTTNNYNINVTAGVGTDPVSVGREVVNAIKRYEATNGKVFAGA